jgi:hypothetical protein
MACWGNPIFSAARDLDGARRASRARPRLTGVWGMFGVNLDYATRPTNLRPSEDIKLSLWDMFGVDVWGGFSPLPRRPLFPMQFSTPVIPASARMLGIHIFLRYNCIIYYLRPCLINHSHAHARADPPVRIVSNQLYMYNYHLRRRPPLIVNTTLPQG